MENDNRSNEIKLQEALQYTRKIINAVHDATLILFDDLIVALANETFYANFAVKPAETEGQFIYDLGNRQWDIPKLRHLLEEIIPATTSFDNFEIENDFKGIGRKVMLLNARRIYVEKNRTRLIIITIKDITDNKKFDELYEKIEQLEERLKKNPEGL